MAENKKWLIEDIEFLKENYDFNNKESLSLKLDRKWKSITDKASNLKLTNPLWTKEETCFLESNYNKMQTKDLMYAINKTASAIAAKANRLNLLKRKKYNKFIFKNDIVEIIIEDNLGRAKDKVLIDKDDYIKVKNIKWHTKICYKKKYVNNKKNGYIHSVILNANKEVDHINGDTLDNRKCNLRMVSKAENSQNRECQINSKTQIRGVFAAKEEKSYRATISKNKKQLILKFTRDIKEADIICRYARAYLFPFSKDAREINLKDVPQWIKDKIDDKF